MDERKELWKAVVVAVCQSSNSTSVSSPIGWADRILKEFDKRFEAEEELT